MTYLYCICVPYDNSFLHTRCSRRIWINKSAFFSTYCVQFRHEKSGIIFGLESGNPLVIESIRNLRRLWVKPCWCQWTGVHRPLFSIHLCAVASISRQLYFNPRSQTFIFPNQPQFIPFDLIKCNTVIFVSIYNVNNFAGHEMQYIRLTVYVICC